MVIWIAFISTVSVGLAIWSSYYYAIKCFGNPYALDVIHPATAISVFFTCLAVVTMQTFFAYRVKVITFRSTFVHEHLKTLSFLEIDLTYVDCDSHLGSGTF